MEQPKKGNCTQMKRMKSIFLACAAGVAAFAVPTCLIIAQETILPTDATWNVQAPTLGNRPAPFGLNYDLYGPTPPGPPPNTVWDWNAAPIMQISTTIDLSQYVLSTV